MNKLTSDRDLYDDLLYMNDPEGLERVKADRKKEQKERQGKERREKWKGRILYFLGKLFWIIVGAVITTILGVIANIIRA